MRRTLSRLALGANLLVLVGSVALWGRSRWIEDSAGWRRVSIGSRPDGTTVETVVGRWGVHTASRCPACGYDLRATPGRCPECRTSASVTARG